MSSRPCPGFICWWAWRTVCIASTDSICAEHEVQEEKQSEQLLNFQPEPPSEELPAELLDTEEEMGPEAEEFLKDQTPFFSKNKGAKKGGRPRKKDLDEKLDGVAKMGSNMYFYTGPGGAESSPSLLSDEEHAPIKKQQETEGARKSSRASKGCNPRLEREDEVVDIPWVKVGIWDREFVQAFILRALLVL